MTIETTDHSLTERPEWKALEAHFKANRDTTLRSLFAADATRGETLSAEGAELFFDYSKNRLNSETIGMLTASRGGC